jgi:hypothetical protein
VSAVLSAVLLAKMDRFVVKRKFPTPPVGHSDLPDPEASSNPALTAIDIATSLSMGESGSMYIKIRLNLDF